jgi:sulfite exporter TauE/SafE
VSTWFSVVLASVLGSLHCVGMCGGLVSFYAGSERESAGRRWAPHAAYHLTRLVAYVILGAIAGGLGSALDLFGSRIGLGDLGVVVAGSTLLFWGIPLLFRRRGNAQLVRLGREPARRRRWVQAMERVLLALAQRVRQRSPLWRASALGLSSALLPCGWLYAFVVLAAGTGSWSAGAGLLVAFWSGTVPALLGLSLGVERLGQRLRSRVPRFSAALVLLVCAFNVVTRWPMASAREPGSLSPPAAPHCHDTH